MRRTSTGASRWPAVAACVVAVVFLAPTRALADSPTGLGDAVGGAVETVAGGASAATGAVDGVVDDVAGVVEETAGAVADVVDDVATVVEDTTDAVADAVDDATDAVAGAVDDVGGAVDEATGGDVSAVEGAADQADGVAGPRAPSSDGAHADAPAAGGGSNGDTVHRTVQPREVQPSTTSHPIPTPMDRGFGPVSLGPARAFAPDVVAATGAHLRAASLAADDPCVADPSLVCLGLLFGIGDFSDAGAEVLGALALTGIGILLVLAVAGGLLLLGSTALVVSVRVRPRTVAA
jgi:hypothetical protein